MVIMLLLPKISKAIPPALVGILVVTGIVIFGNIETDIPVTITTTGQVKENQLIGPIIYLIYA